MPPSTSAAALRAAARMPVLRRSVPTLAGQLPHASHATAPAAVMPKLAFRQLSTAAPAVAAATSLGASPRVHVSPITTLAASPAARRPTASHIARPSTILSSLRTAPSSSVRLQSTAAAAAAPGPQGLPQQAQRLDWNTFFRLRKTRRRFQLAFSLVMFVAAGFGSFVYFGTGAADPIVSQIPLDPFFTLGLMTLGCGALGWLIGPSIGSGLFYAFNRQWKTQMRVKENEFFARIKKNRVDPTNSSAGNPVPDFYGEKISSVAGYRQWLKDQRAFNKKRTSFV